MSTHPDLLAENAELRARLAEAQETLDAIRSGAVDALVVSGEAGEQVFSLQGAETPYRLLMESMSEGAATIAPDGTVLYCNHRLAEMAGRPAERIVGAPLDQCVPADQRSTLAEVLANAMEGGIKAEFTLSCGDSPGVPVLLSFSPISLDSGAVAVVATDLSERKHYEQKLNQLNQELDERVHRRTAELQAIFDTAPIGLAITDDPQGRHIRGNPANVRMLGLEPGEELSLSALKAPRYRPMQDGREVPVEQLPMQRAVRGETVTGQIMDVRRPDGTTITLYSSAVPLLDEQGRPRGAVGAFLDISERRRMEEALRQSEERYRLLFDRNPDGMFAVDTAGRFLIVNPACETISGYSLDELRQKTFMDLCAPDQRANTLAYFERGLREGQALHLETALVRKDGRRVELWVTGEPLVVGQQTLVHCTAKDITARKGAEQAVFAANQRLQALMQALPVGVSFSDDATGQHITGNPAVLAQFEVTATPDESAPGRQVRFFRNGQPMTNAELPLQRAVAENREIRGMEFEVLLPSGRRWYAQGSGAPIRDQQGQVVGGVAVTVDITVLKEAEAALRSKEAELRAITEVTPVMLTRCSQDLRYRYANHAYASMLGTTPEQIVGKPIVEIMGEKGLATIRPRVEQVLQGQAVEYEDEVHYALTGKSRWLHVSYMPDRDERGQVVGWIASITDITERKQAEEALRRIEEERKVAEAVQVERQRFQDVLNMLPAYVILLSPDHRVPFANRFFEERFGKSEARRGYEHLFDRNGPHENCESFKVLQTNTPHHWEWAGPDGRNYDISDFPFRDVDGSPLILEVGLDITERKKAETELTRHREHLQDLVHERTAKLRETNDELMRFNQAMVGRELRMIELKQEINALCRELGKPPPYPLQAEKEEPDMPANG
jgi:PAS domain S-box-containing protein